MLIFTWLLLNTAAFVATQESTDTAGPSNPPGDPTITLNAGIEQYLNSLPDFLKSIHAILRFDRAPPFPVSLSTEVARWHRKSDFLPFKEAVDARLRLIEQVRDSAGPLREAFAKLQDEAWNLDDQHEKQMLEKREWEFLGDYKREEDSRKELLKQDAEDSRLDDKTKKAIERARVIEGRHGLRLWERTQLAANDFLRFWLRSLKNARQDLSREYLQKSLQDLRGDMRKVKQNLSRDDWRRSLQRLRDQSAASFQSFGRRTAAGILAMLDNLKSVIGAGPQVERRSRSPNVRDRKFTKDELSDMSKNHPYLPWVAKIFAEKPRAAISWMRWAGLWNVPKEFDDKYPGWEEKLNTILEIPDSIFASALSAYDDLEKTIPSFHPANPGDHMPKIEAAMRKCFLASPFSAGKFSREL